MDDELQSALTAHARVGQQFELRIGEGWRDLVLACHRAVAAEFPHCELLAIKEKYGSLAFQAFPRKWHPASPDGSFSAWSDEESERLNSIVESFEERSAVTCERCGKPGALREERRHILTLCDDCDAQVED